MRPEEFFDRLDKIEAVLDSLKAAPSDPTRWSDLVAISYSELRWCVRVMRHCSRQILDEEPTRPASHHRAPARLPPSETAVRPKNAAEQILERLDQIDQRIANVELSGVWAVPIEEP